MLTVFLFLSCCLQTCHFHFNDPQYVRQLPPITRVLYFHLCVMVVLYKLVRISEKSKIPEERWHCRTHPLTGTYHTPRQKYKVTNTQHKKTTLLKQQNDDEASKLKNKKQEKGKVEICYITQVCIATPYGLHVCLCQQYRSKEIGWS